MKKVYKLKVLLLVSMFFLPINALSAEYKIRVSTSFPDSHSVGRAVKMFKSQFEEAAGGKVAVELHHNSSLGGARETLEMAKMGTLDITITGSTKIQYVPELGIVVLPYLWKDSETMFNVLDGELGGLLNSKLEKAGFQTLAWWDNGFRHITNSRGPIEFPKDVEGLKIRILPTPSYIAFFKAVGAAPTPMSWSELYEALRSGVVDAQENPPSVIYTGRLAEVQKYCSLTGHVNEPVLVLMSQMRYKKLPADLKQMMKDVLNDVTAWQRAENAKDNEEFVGKLKEQGMQINAIPDEGFAEFRKMALEIYPTVAKEFGDNGKDLVERFSKATE